MGMVLVIEGEALREFSNFYSVFWVKALFFLAFRKVFVV